MNNKIKSAFIKSIPNLIIATISSCIFFYMYKELPFGTNTFIGLFFLAYFACFLSFLYSEHKNKRE
ncbi:hypothetical protein [Metaclostridioides mangenotii]|uniref:Lipoprotein n=1 Tax=Metaclostridioides mangenotii TaxID=1540 RepID=A0ABS4EBZ7_9FIRM|nr:hypothetical protein [Clostridioides mangenotii]MBP1855426.1 hypothetical protein [Clostridioides mangenotii]